METWILVSEPVESSIGWHIIQLVTKATNPVTSSKFTTIKQNYFTNWLEDVRNSRDDIVVSDNWSEYCPETPAVPDDLYEYVISSGS